MLRARSGFFWQKKSNNLNQIDQVSLKRKVAFSVEAESFYRSLEEPSEIFSTTLQKLKLVANKELFKVKPTSPPISLPVYNSEYWRIFIVGFPNIPTPTPSVVQQEQQSPSNLGGSITPRQSAPTIIADAGISEEELSVQFSERENYNLNLSNSQAQRNLNISNQTIESRQQTGVAAVASAINNGNLMVTETSNQTQTTSA